MQSQGGTLAALCGFAVGAVFTYLACGGLRGASRVQRTGDTRDVDRKASYTVAGCKGKLWGAIGSALTAAQIYAGDRLGLYARLPNSESTAVTSAELAEACGLNERWIREWLAQQSAAGLIAALPSSAGPEAALKFYLPLPHRAVLSDDASDDCTLIRSQAASLS